MQQCNAAAGTAATGHRKQRLICGDSVSKQPMPRMEGDSVAKDKELMRTSKWEERGCMKEEYRELFSFGDGFVTRPGSCTRSPAS